MRLIRNLALFFVVFLPASCATGLAGGFFTGPLDPPRIAYDIGLYLFRVLPLLLPSVLAVPVLHFVYRATLLDDPPARARSIAAIATPFALLSVHLAVFGVAFLSTPLLALFAIAGALYGAVFALPRA